MATSSSAQHDDPSPAGSAAPAPPRIRTATVSDALAWARFLAAEQARTYTALPGSLALPDSWGRVLVRSAVLQQPGAERELAAPGRHRIAEVDGDGGPVVVAVASAGEGALPWEEERGLVPPLAPQQLVRLYVHPEFRGGGLAHALLDAVLEPGPAYLWILHGNDRAERFYAKHGFAPIDETVLAGRSWRNAPMRRLVRNA